MKIELMLKATLEFDEHRVRSTRMCIEEFLELMPVKFGEVKLADMTVVAGMVNEKDEPSGPQIRDVTIRPRPYR